MRPLKYQVDILFSSANPGGKGGLRPPKGKSGWANRHLAHPPILHNNFKNNTFWAGNRLSMFSNVQQIAWFPGLRPWTPTGDSKRFLTDCAKPSFVQISPQYLKQITALRNKRVGCCYQIQL